MNDEEELVVEAFLTFLYTWDYAAFFKHGGGATARALHDGDSVLAQALFNIKVFVAADKYGVAALQEQAVNVFGDALLGASSVPAVAPPARAVSASSWFTQPLLSQQALQAQQQQQTEQKPRLTPAALVTIINELYYGAAAALPHNRMRIIVAHVVSYGIGELMREPAFVALLEGGNSSSSSRGFGPRYSFAIDAVKYLAKRLSPEQKPYRCPACNKIFEALWHPSYMMPCYHCKHVLELKKWASYIVRPDVATLGLESDESK